MTITRSDQLEALSAKAAKASQHGSYGRADGPFHSRATHVSSHRNGVGGCGFWAVHFTFRPDGWKRGEPPTEAIGWFHREGDDDESNHYGVVIPSDPSYCLRGDNFVDWMRGVVKVYSNMRDKLFAEWAAEDAAAAAVRNAVHGPTGEP